MTSLRFRLTLTYLVVILVGMGLAVLLAWLSVERLYVDAQKANLLAQAQLVATALQATPQQSPTMVEPYAQTTNVLPGIHTRVIEEQGAVVIDLPELMPTTQEVVSPLPQLAQNTAGEVSPDELLNRRLPFGAWPWLTAGACCTPLCPSGLTRGRCHASSTSPALCLTPDGVPCPFRCDGGWPVRFCWR